MIVQIDNTNAKTAKSGHVFKDDCPDRVDDGVNDDRNVGKIDIVIKSGHGVKCTDILDVNDISGHEKTIRVNRFNTISLLDIEEIILVGSP